METITIVFVMALLLAGIYLTVSVRRDLRESSQGATQGRPRAGWRTPRGR